MGFGESIRGRRLSGVAALAGALAMLVIGQTGFREHLQGPVFLVYWGSCFALTLFAMVMALRDARAVRHRTQQEERALLQDTIKEIISEAKAKSSSPQPGAERGLKKR